MRLSRIVLLSLIVFLAIAPMALAQETAPSSDITQQEDRDTQTWQWPELGLSLEYPAGWQFTLSSESADFVLYGEPTDTGNFPFVSLQSGNYDPETEVLTEIFAEIAGEDTTLTEIEFGGQPAWQFDFSDHTQMVSFIGFSAGESTLAILGFVVPNEITEATAPVIEAIIASAEIQVFALDNVLLNSQMQFNYDDFGVIGVGNPEAPVTLYEFLDFSCPHCGHFATSVAWIAQDYVASEDVFLQFVLLDIIGGEASRMAATAQVCAVELNIGWDVHELLFEEILFGTEELAYTAEDIAAVVENAELGISGEEFGECLANTDVTELIEANSALATELDVTSTPSLLFSNADSETADYIRGSDGEAYRGGLPLVLVYEHIDSLLPVIAE